MKTFKKLLLLSLVLVSALQAVTISALNFTALNSTANSNIQLLWNGSNLLSRTEHTAIWWYNPVQQTGYYAVAWHSPNTGSWDGGAYSTGTHPWPGSDCAVGVDGSGSNGTGGAGTAHCWEIAGTGAANDWLAPALVNPGYTVVKSKWYKQVRRCHLATTGTCTGLYEHLFIPDYINNPTQIITHCIASITGAGATPAFYFGSSDWQANACGANCNDETVGGKLRGIQLFNAALSDADIATEVTNESSNTPLTSAGQSAVWYINHNPIPSDIADKSTAGHTPTWANANRPVQWDSTYGSSGAAGRGTLMGIGR